MVAKGQTKQSENRASYNQKVKKYKETEFSALLIDMPGMVSYTYRNSFQKDVAATLDTIKSLGFTNLEFSNLFGRTAAEIRAMLDARGMVCTPFYGTSYENLVTKTDEVASNANTLGANM